MKKIKQLLLVVTLVVTASSVGLAQAINSCGADKMRSYLVKEHPEILQSEQELEQFTNEYIQSQSSMSGARSGPYVIPVVFHILHQGGSENISDAQVLDAMRILNEDFNKKNSDTSIVIGEFKSIIANSEIEFRLANIDPYGNCTNGIERIYTCQTYRGNDFSKLNNWPREKYLNIWVVKSMRDGVAGYSYYPSTVDALYNTPAMDGVIILSNYIGSIGSGSPNYARALTHEVGHWLNLKHPWGDTNEPGVSCGDDEVNDTPPTRGSNLSCNLNLNYCNPGNKENVQNYMDYSYCSRMYTEGQKLRMHAALNSNKADRNNLYTAANLANTGTENVTTNSCGPIAAMSVSKRYTCLGESVTFSDASFNGEVTDYFWEFPTGTPSVAFTKNVVVTFNTAGWQPAKLTVTNPLGVSTIADTLVYVAHQNTLYTAPFFEDFEDPNSIAEYEWASINYDKGTPRFQQFFGTGNSGNSCMMVNNYWTRADHDIDELISPPFDLTGLNNQQMNFSFYYSLATWNQYFTDVVDSIAILATSNCGNNWTNIYKKAGYQIVNAGYQVGYFTPTSSPSFWKYLKFNLPQILKQPNVRFKIQVFSAVKGNNFFIDDINIGGASPTGINTDLLSQFSVVPNPFNNEVRIQSLNEGDYNIYLKNIIGETVMSTNITATEDGITLRVNDELSAGIYFLTIQKDHTFATVKLIKQ